MNNQLSNNNNNNIKTIDSREIAEMLGIKHWEVLRKLDGTDKTKGIIPVLTDNKIVVSDYFIKSSYKDPSGKENRCYLFTKMGCEFIANKFTGEKGILFTAKYVKRFNEMEQLTPSYIIQDPIERAKQWIKEQEEKRLLEAQIKQDKPFVAICKERIDKGECVSLTDITKGLGLKRGQISKWAKANGYLSKQHTEINKKGEEYFKIYRNGSYKSIGIRAKGVELINNNLEEIKNFKNK